MFARYGSLACKPSLWPRSKCGSIPTVLHVLQRPASSAARWTLAEDEKFKQLRSEGMTFRQISTKVGRSVDACTARYYNYLSHDIPRSDQGQGKRNDRRTNPLSLKVFEWVQQGRLLADIAKELGVSSRTVRSRYNDVCPPHLRESLEKSRVTHLPYTSADNELILRRTSQGVSRTAIAAELGRNRRSLSLHISRTSNLRECVSASYKRFTTAEDNTITSGLASGVPHSNIAKQLKRSRTSIYSRVRVLQSQAAPNSLKPTKHNAKWTDRELQELIKLFDGGMSRAELASHFQRNSVNFALDLAREKLGHERTKTRQIWSTEMEGSLIRIRDEDGSGFAEIASKLGVSQRAAYHRYKVLKDSKRK